VRREASVAPGTAIRKEQKKERTTREDWAEFLPRTFAIDVFACPPHAGSRRVLAYFTV
jgi:hypothetical protein